MKVKLELYRHNSIKLFFELLNTENLFTNATNVTILIKIIMINYFKQISSLIIIIKNFKVSKYLPWIIFGRFAPYEN